MNLLHRLQEHFRAALTEWVADPTSYLAMIKPAQDARNGDYQANFAMPLAKSLGKKPTELAKEIATRLPFDGFIDRAEVAGPGFINFHLSTKFLAEQVRVIAADERLGVPLTTTPETYVI